jgi:hypothetical protein
MTTIERIEPEFVDEVPRELRPGRLYISIAYGTALHLCCCGCGSEVVTPLHPTRWRLVYDGEAVSLHPSIGSWSLPCRSHYVIHKNNVRWAPTWSDKKIEMARALDRAEINRYFDPDPIDTTTAEPDESQVSPGAPVTRFMSRLWWRMTRR